MKRETHRNSVFTRRALLAMGGQMTVLAVLGGRLPGPGGIARPLHHRHGERETGSAPG